MNLLYISHFYPPKFNAGTENYTHSLARSFQNQGHDVRVLCAEGWQTGEKYWNGVSEESFEGIPVQRIHLNWTQSANPNKVLYDSLEVESWLEELLKSNKPDLVHVTSTHTLGVGILRCISRARIPLILTLMDFWFVCPNHQLIKGNNDLCDGKTTPWECQSCLLTNSNSFKRLGGGRPSNSRITAVLSALARYPIINKQRGLRGMLLNIDERKNLLAEALTLPDIVLTHSRFVQSVFSQHSLKEVSVLPNGHDLSWKERFQEKNKTSLIRFGYMGQIQWAKGLHILVEAFNKSNIYMQANLKIWGDVSRNQAYTQFLQALIKNNPSISLEGRFSRDQLAEVLAEIDVLVVPSIWYENAPLVIQEAFAANIPVIATNLGGMAEFVNHNINGLLFERNDVDDLAAQFQRIVNEPKLLDSLQRGIPAVKPIEQEVLELEAIYRDLIKRKDGDGSFKLVDRE